MTLTLILPSSQASTKSPLIAEQSLDHIAPLDDQSIEPRSYVGHPHCASFCLRNIQACGNTRSGQRHLALDHDDAACGYIPHFCQANRCRTLVLTSRSPRISALPECVLVILCS